MGRREAPVTCARGPEPRGLPCVQCGATGNRKQAPCPGSHPGAGRPDWAGDDTTPFGDPHHGVGVGRSLRWGEQTPSGRASGVGLAPASGNSESGGCASPTPHPSPVHQGLVGGRRPGCPPPAAGPGHSRAVLSGAAQVGTGLAAHPAHRHPQPLAARPSPGPRAGGALPLQPATGGQLRCTERPR